LLDAGINVAAGSDSMFDIWYRFNRLDPVETGYISCLSAGMRTDDEVRNAFDMVTTRAAKIVGKEALIAVGAPADLVVHAAPNIVQVLRNLPGRRLNIKNGRVVGGQDSSHWCIR
jgi:cytosine deaminase